LERAAGELLLLLPSEGRRLARLRHRLARRLEATPSRPVCLIHGDLHGDNVLVDREGVGLVDLDDGARGDPAQDLGSMWAQLRWLSIKRARRSPPLERGPQAFVDGYLEGLPGDAGAGVPVQAARHCLLFAHRCLRHGAAPAHRDQAQALLATAEQILENGLR